MTQPRKATEHDFATFVLDLARYLGWRTAHFRPARTDKGWRTPVQGDGVGFPDLVLVRAPRLIFAELKSERGKLRPEQAAWLEELREVESRADYDPAAGPAGSWPPDEHGPVEVYVWRPADVEQIREVLART